MSEAIQQELHKSKEQGVLDSRALEVLQRTIVDAFNIVEIHEMYTRVISEVARELDWDIAHVFQCTPDLSDGLISTDIWFLSDPERYKEFVRRTNSIRTYDSPDFPVSLLGWWEPRWTDDARRIDSRSAERVRTIAGEGAVVHVSVPVVQDGSLVAVLEFLSERAQGDSSAWSDFFSLLGIQIGYALAHHQSNRNQRDQFSALAQVQKMSTLGEMLAGIAHEINNPVATISLISQVLKRMGRQLPLTAQSLHEQLGKIDCCVERILAIVKKLLHFSRDSSMDGFQPVLLSEIVESVVGLSEARFKQRGVRLTVPDIPPHLGVECRSSQVCQILLNFLANALDAVEGQQDSWVRIECEDQGGVVELAVSDSGPGIAPAVQVKIMKSFFTTKPKGKGTGLGLSISRAIAQEHGGNLRYDDTAPHTRFVLTLPKKQQSAT